MRKIRKRVFTTVLAAVLLFTMPETAAAAMAENMQTEDVSENITKGTDVNDIDNALEEPERLADDTKKPETDNSDTDKLKTEAGEAEETTEEESGRTSKEDTEYEDANTDAEKCICDTLCTEDSINEDCPVCGAEDADFSCCKGENMEEDSIEAPPKMEESGTETKIITAWKWIDPEEYLTDGMLALPGAGRGNPAFLADVTVLLPEKIQAEVIIANVMEDGEEVFKDTEASLEALPEAEEMEIALTGWKCANYPEDGAYGGVYTFYASLPEGLYWRKVRLR